MSVDLTQTILSRVDIVDVAQKLGISKAQYKVNICCPFHGDKNPSFRFYRDDNGGHFKCFSDPNCTSDGVNIFALVMKLKDCDFKVALEYLCNELGIQRESSRQLQSPEDKALHLTRYFFSKNFDNSPAQSYMKGRGISEEALKAFEIGYALPGNRLSKYGHRHLDELKSLGIVSIGDDNNSFDFFRSRVIFPIHSNTGNLIGFSGRVLNQSKPKYLNSSESNIFKKSSTLYNLNRISNIQKQVIVVEGYMDVIGLWQRNYKNAVCAMGTAISKAQIEIITNRFNDIIFMFDGDKAGRSAAWSVAKELISFTDLNCSFRFVFLDGDIDPYDISLTKSDLEISNLLENSQFLSDFIISQAQELIGFRKNNPEKILELVDRLQEFLNLAPPGIFRDSIASEISSIENVSANRIPSINVNGDISKSLIRDLEEVLLKYPNVSLKKTESLKITWNT